MEFKGTKGEWEVKHSESKDAFNVIGTLLGGKYKIARCPYLVTDYKPLNEKEKAETEANAKLIAAAPETIKRLLKSTIQLEEILKESQLDPARERSVKACVRENKKVIEKALG